MSDVITYSLRRLFTGSTSTCGYDYVIIRDGSTANGPPLHVWCRGTAEEEEEVKSYSNSIYVELVATSYDRSGIVFIMSYSATEKNLVIESPVELEPLNYFLIAVSCLVIIALIAGIVILVYREIKLAREAKAVKFKQKLRVRRKGISGISGGVMNKHFLPDDIEEERKSMDENSYSAVSVTPDSRGLDNTVSTSLSSETPTLDRRPDSASLRRVSFANNRDHSQGSMSLASLYIGQRIEHLINDDSSLTRISVTSSSDTGV